MYIYRERERDINNRKYIQGHYVTYHLNCIPVIGFGQDKDTG